MLKAWILRLLGQKAFRLDVGVKTQFRGRKNQLQLPEWQEIAAVFQKTPDLEDYLRLHLEGMEKTLRQTSINSDGDRARLVLQAQAEVIQDMLNLPVMAAARVTEMMKPKAVHVPKGNSNVR